MTDTRADATTYTAPAPQTITETTWLPHTGEVGVLAEAQLRRDGVTRFALAPLPGLASTTLAEGHGLTETTAPVGGIVITHGRVAPAEADLYGVSVRVATEEGWLTVHEDARPPGLVERSRHLVHDWLQTSMAQHLVRRYMTAAAAPEEAAA